MLPFTSLDDFSRSDLRMVVLIVFVILLYVSCFFHYFLVDQENERKCVACGCIWISVCNEYVFGLVCLYGGEAEKRFSCFCNIQ